MPTATRTPAGIALAEKRSKVVALRIEGKTLERIAEIVGLAGDSSVRYHLDEWLASIKPSAEQTEELRQVQALQLDALHDRLWARLDSDDYLAVTDRLVKLMDRKARLMGLDLERNVSVSVVPTAEALASLFGWDGSAGVVDVEATEVIDDEA